MNSKAKRNTKKN